MTTTQEPEQTRAHLQELVNNSAALNSLPEDARTMRAEMMLSADPDTMLEFIKVLEEEAAKLQKMDEDFVKKTEEIEGLVVEAQQLEKEAEREIRHAEEDEEKVKSEAHAAALLKKLDNITS
jgi:hypothetical protein